jgi:teichuronic acid biosynthesis protein TuaE
MRSPANRPYAAAPTAAATSSATREWFTINAALAPEAAASSALWTGLPASPATYTPATVVSLVVGSLFTRSVEEHTRCSGESGLISFRFGLGAYLSTVKLQNRTRDLVFVLFEKCCYDATFMLRYTARTWLSSYKSEGPLFYAWLAVLATAFVGSSVAAMPVGPVHIFPFRIALFAFVLFYAWRLWKTQTLPEFSPIARSIVGALLVFLAYSTLSMTWAPGKFLALTHIFFMGSGVALVIVTAALVNTTRRLWILAIGLFAVTAIVLLVALIEYLTRIHFSGSAANLYPLYRQRTPTGFFTNPNDLATVIVLFTPVCLLYAMRSRRWRSMLLGSGVAALGLGFVFLTIGARANMVAALLGLGCAAVFLRDRRLWTFIGLTTALIVMLNFTLLDQNLINRIDLAVRGPAAKNTVLEPAVQQRLDENRNVILSLQSLSSGESQSSREVRLLLIKNGLVFFRDSYFVGVGAGNSSWYLENKSPQPAIDSDGTLKTNLHNWWIELLVNYGLAGFLAYVAAFAGIGLSLLVLIRRRGRNEKDSLLLVAALMGMGTFTISVVGPSSVAALMPQWVFFGFALAVVNTFQRSSGVE